MGIGLQGYFWAFLIGGIICAIGQLIIDRTNWTPARVTVLFVVSGVILGAMGLYQPFINLAGAGATVPLTGFGYLLATGVKQAVEEKGLLGAFTGGFTVSSAGISATILFALLVSLFSNPKHDV